MPDIIDGVDQERTSIGTAELRPLAVIIGTEGDDAGETALIGTEEDDEIRGLGGNDEIFGRGGNDELRGGPGNDVLRGGPGADTVFGGLDDDTIRGGDGSDTLYGGDGDDLIQGLAGNDQIFGEAGNDELRGGNGADVIRGGPGNDDIFGGAGNDQLFGGADNDVIEGREGNDVISGGDGADQLFGGPGDDDIRGGPGNDLLVGGQGDDELRGNQGNDIIDGKRGADTMFGGGGADTFRFTVFDQVFNRIEDFDPAEDRLDIREIVNFQDGDDIDDFVLFEQFPEGTRVSIDSNGPAGGINFIPLVGLFGTQVESLTLAQLGLQGGFVTERQIASTTADGTPGDGTSFTPALSADGRFVTFSSSATNFIADDDETFDIFVKDLLTGDIERASQTAAGVGGNDDSFIPAISADGDRVSFDSGANNLPGDLNPGNRDVFVADRSDGSIQFASIEDNQFASLASISGDGRLVAFEATATGRAGTDDPAGAETITQRIFVRDLTDDSLQEVSTNADGDFADLQSVRSDISADGRFVAFDSAATNLTPDDDNPAFDVFRKNLDDGTIDLVSVTADGSQDVGRSSLAPSISGNGRFVAFQTTARLAEDDFDNISDIYVKDLETGEITLVSRSAAGAKGDEESLSPSISDDGSLVAFRSAADNLVPGDDNGFHDIFVKNVATGEIQRFAVDSDTSDVAIPQGIVNLRPALSGDGSTVAFSDEVTITEEGGIGASQIAVAPVAFGAGVAAAGDGMSLEAMLVPDEVAAV